ncbi:peptide ABC transporter substrate-binding protein [Clostridium sp. Marseille-Q2269]|uniref:peptide ABC transporter substrate-binding protein n=1 Tax=Clostridium sp. Marseille-Q2269 TaxID=2942205 RepID=UPI0020742854|nr:peptide ABC transporter substrate-binding protein [Clostridium sp. Marseille-Q2269]
MKSKRLVSTLVSCMLLASVALVGCGGKKSASGGKGADKEQYLNMVLQEEPKNLDPSKSEDLYSSQVISEINEGLTRIEVDDKGKDVVKPAGAEKWDVSKDGLKWTFHLRDYEWSDGKKVTAKDYEYGIKRTLDPKTASQYAYLLSPIKNANEYNGGKAKAEDVGVKALDDKTLEITLKGPCAYFLKTTYFKVMMPQRKDIVEKHGEKFGTEASNMIFSGPFKIKEWVHGNKIELVKNEKYWDAKSVKLNNVHMKIINNQASAMQELLNGGVDFANVQQPEWKDKLGKTGNFQVKKIVDPSTNYEFYNQKIKLFSNNKVRKAFSLAVNREEISKTLFKNDFTPAYGFVPPSLQIGDKEYRKEAGEEPVKKLKDENKDPKKLLVEGLKELGMDPDPSKVTITYLAASTGDKQKEISEFYQEMYQKALGIKVKIEYTQWPVYMKRMNNGQYEISGMAWSGDYNDPMTDFDLWMTGANIVPTNWSNPKYDELIKKAASLPEEKNEERMKLFKEAEDILLYKDTVIAPVVYRARNVYERNYVKGIMISQFGSLYDIKYAYTEGRK